MKRPKMVTATLRMSRHNMEVIETILSLYCGSDDYACRTIAKSAVIQINRALDATSTDTTGQEGSDSPVSAR